MEAVRTKHDYYGSRGVASEMLDQKALREAEPNLADGLAGGLLVKTDTVVYQLVATQFLIENAERRGAVVRTGTAVANIDDSGVKLESGEMVPAGKVINAAGASAAKLTPQLNIKKRKGHLVITERYNGFVRHQLVELGYLRSAHGIDAESVAFNVQPRSTGQVLVGSSRQFGASGNDVDNNLVRKMVSRAFTYMPRLKKLSAVRIWTGFRPATPDNLPFIGAIPGFKNVYAAAGHEGLGITTSLGTAALLTDEIMGRPPAIPVEKYSPARML
jgi:glycine/D-amino acid oxidase-like deaminating enzyme